MKHKLQNLLRHPTNIQQIKEYLSNNKQPTNPKLTEDFMEEFELRADKLVYIPDDLLVLENAEQAEAEIRKTYEDFSTSAGLGIQKFYEVLADKYLGVTRDMCRNFLMKQEAFQQTRQFKKKVNRPVLSRGVDHLWSMDLVDMTRFAWANNGNKYILVVVDVFSRFLYTFPLKNKTAKDVADRLSEIMTAEHTPKHLLSDNGGEFLNEVNELCKSKGIKRRFSRSYSPESNGLVEGINRLIRNKLNDAFARFGTKNWVRYLPEVTESWNKTTHGGVKHDPTYIYESQADDVEDERANVDKTLRLKARKAIAKNRTGDLSVGDYVRLSLTVTDSNLRKELKTGKVSNSKWADKKWSDEVYKVRTVSAGSDFSKSVFTLEYLDGRRAYPRRHFFANQLLKIPEPPPRTEPPPQRTQPQRTQQRRTQLPPLPQPPRRSGRQRRGTRNDDFEYDQDSD